MFKHLSYPVLNIYTQDRGNAWRYARWKYGIDTSDLASIFYNPIEGCRAVTITNIFDVSECGLRNPAFENENVCASTLGHENVHGANGYLYRIRYPNCDEAEAYLWEINHTTVTEISSDDISDIQTNYTEYSEQCNP